MNLWSTSFLPAWQLFNIYCPLCPPSLLRTYPNQLNPSCPSILVTLNKNLHMPWEISKWKISSWQHPSYWTDSSRFRGKILFLLHYFLFAQTHDWHVLSVNLNIRKQRLHSNELSDCCFQFWHTPVTRNNVMYNWHTVTHCARTKKGNFLHTEQWNGEHVYRHCSIASFSVAQWRVAQVWKTSVSEVKSE